MGETLLLCSYQVLQDNSGQPYDPAPLINKTVSNVINNVIFGRRYAYDDPCFVRHVETLEANMRILGNCGALSVFPFLKYLPGDYFKYKHLKKQNALLEEDIRQRIKQHRYARRCR